ncbi:hypothetical protein ABPG75_008055 [Micractinium tetrahymenae]
MQPSSCRAAWAGPSPAQAHRPARQRRFGAGPAQAAPPAGPLVLERRAAEPAGGPGVAAGRSAGGQPTRGSTPPHRQRSSRTWQLEQQQWQPAWVLQGGGALLLADAHEAWPTAAAAPDDGGSLRVQLNDSPPRPPQLQQGDGSSPPGGGGRDPDQQDFFANVGDAIRTLREDYPLLFVKDLNYSIYREDLTFKDPNLTFHGLKAYRAIFWGLRFHGKLLLQAANVRVLRIWQPEDAVIKLRWQINAKPRLSGTPGTFDGISIYRLDRRGKVYQHEVTDVQLRDPPITNPLLYGLNFILSPRPQVQQVPCPGSWYVDGEEEELPEVLAVAPVLLPGGSADHL